MSEDYKPAIRGVLNELRPLHYDEKMWEHALNLDHQDLEELDRMAGHLQFIAQYVRDTRTAGTRAHTLMMKRDDFR